MSLLLPAQGLQRLPLQRKAKSCPTRQPGAAPSLARWRRAKTPPAAPRTACVLRPGHSASTPPRRSLRSGARPAGRVGVGSPVCSLLEVAAAAALAARTPLGIRTKRLLPAPRGWSSHPNPGLAQGKVQPPVALRRARDQLPVRLSRPSLWEAENGHRSSESCQSKSPGPFDTDLWRDSAWNTRSRPFSLLCNQVPCSSLQTFVTLPV